MLYHLEFADWVPVPIPRVFAYFAEPENLPGLMRRPPAPRRGVGAGTTILQYTALAARLV
jgi:hypothetical protein